MPLTRFKLSAIEDGGIATADLADGSVTTAKIADSAVTSVKTSNLFTNTEIAGTEGARMPVGTTAQRANAQSGDIRFNSTLSLMEYYDGSAWKAIDSPPTVTSISPDNFDTAGDTITVSGSNFQSGATVKIIAADNQELLASTVSITNDTTLTFDITSAMVADDNDPYGIQVINPSGLSGTLGSALDFAPEPAWTVAAGTLATIYDSARAGHGNITTGATSTESDATVTYAVTTGSLPSGLSIASSTGIISGTANAVGSDTTSTFTLTATATDGSGNTTTNTRQYSIIVKAPVVTSYTSTGSGTFSVPTGTSAVDVLVVAGGGGGGNTDAGTDGGGGGGAGGLIYRPAFPVTPGGSVSYTVGAGGPAFPIFSSQQSDGSQHPNPQANSGRYGGLSGGDSTFGTLTAKGGGGGGSGPWRAAFPGGSGGGHGGGGAANPIGQTTATATQPQQPGDSGTYGFGNNGGQAPVSSPHEGAGGGGAGGVGGNANNNTHGEAGGVGKSYSISGSSVGYAGGGGGAASGGGGQGGDGTSGGGDGGNYGGNNGAAGTGNRGGGGGGGAGSGSYYGGTGGSGIVIVKY